MRRLAARRRSSRRNTGTSGCATPGRFRGAGGRPVALCFKTNSWGGKYELPGDELVRAKSLRHGACRERRFDWVLEGGAVDGTARARC